MEAEGISLSGINALPGRMDYAPATTAHSASSNTSKPATVADPKQTASATPSLAQVQAAAADLSKALDNLNHGIRFKIDQTTHQIIVQIYNRKTNEVIDQIPPQVVLNLAHHLRQYVGVLLDAGV